eukprot:364545-Chlamydomonas_euryale.AAC.5
MAMHPDALERISPFAQMAMHPDAPVRMGPSAQMAMHPCACAPVRSFALTTICACATTVHART